jgi:hypothetical protein
VSAEATTSLKRAWHVDGNKSWQLGVSWCNVAGKPATLAASLSISVDNKQLQPQPRPVQ